MLAIGFSKYKYLFYQLSNINIICRVVYCNSKRYLYYNSFKRKAMKMWCATHGGLRRTENEMIDATKK